jgi:hypothetical protein
MADDTIWSFTTNNKNANERLSLTLNDDNELEIIISHQSRKWVVLNRVQIIRVFKNIDRIIESVIDKVIKEESEN